MVDRCRRPCDTPHQLPASGVTPSAQSHCAAVNMEELYTVAVASIARMPMRCRNSMHAAPPSGDRSALLGNTHSLAPAASRLRVLALHAQAPVVPQAAMVPAEAKMTQSEEHAQEGQPGRARPVLQEGDLLSGHLASA